MVEVSVIVPVYRVEKYLPKCVDSILNQTFNDFELILIDDGSPDKSGAICDAYARKDARIRVIHQNNSGVGNSRNKGLAESKGKYVYFCDSDDYLDPQLLEDNVKLLNDNDANLVIFGYYDEKLNKTQVRRKERIPLKNEFLKSKQAFRLRFEELFSLSIMYTLWNKLYRRSYLVGNRYEFENISMGEDTRFNLSVYQNLDRVCLNKKIYYHYIVQRPDSAANKYRPDYFHIRFKETQKLDTLIRSWGYQDQFRDLLYNEWIVTLIYGVKSVFHKDCPMNENEKKQTIHSFINEPPIKKTLNNISFRALTGSMREKIRKLIFMNTRRKSIFLLLKYLYKVK
ncbi:glycosyltransferase family 2 protein [Sporolactobacillus sp. THM19-2]|uniref:glycosyltransferase family 2 protein n=1 Tax=Sporolactobacillus sp. THM19-2 TaxID=2511171 RepID=UPI0010228E4D|nr:glycosyltransferase family 2 protein [Sporolactobacillus sp. THM19-2]RYL93955.1 glycosyltransferase family 2 protein [Sporolactobacillus sp. THM19-2]